MRDITLYLKCKRHAVTEWHSSLSRKTQQWSHAIAFFYHKKLQRWNEIRKRWDWDSDVNKSWHYVQWVFKLNVRIQCLNWMFTLMFDMHNYIECQNWIFESNGECPTCKCDLYIWILKGKVSIKDVKFKSNTRLFEDNIQMLHERFEDYHQMFNLIDWLFVCLERIIKCLNHKLKVNSKYCTAQVNVYMFE